jgi:4-hydroxy-tetrahydrodipicolinate reductase
MKIALIGYGKMGKLIEGLAEERGHQKVVVVNESHAGLPAKQLAETLQIADVAIDFSTADAVKRNVEACMIAGIPIVEGTTGWAAELDEVKSIVSEYDGAMVYGANFSIGVNLFYRMVEHAAGLMAKFDDYEAFIEEQHHSRKKDAPSGTALKLKEIVGRDFKEEFSISSTRAGKIPGTHRVGFDSEADQILLEHTARSRDGFGIGAIKAAEWIVERKGSYDFRNVMEGIIGDKA